MVPLIKNKSSFYPSFNFFRLRISSKNPFVLAEGFVVVFPATEGIVLFFTAVTLVLAFVEKFGAVLFPFTPPFNGTLLK